MPARPPGPQQQQRAMVPSIRAKHGWVTCSRRPAGQDPSPRRSKRKPLLAGVMRSVDLTPTQAAPQKHPAVVGVVAVLVTALPLTAWPAAKGSLVRWTGSPCARWRCRAWACGRSRRRRCRRRSGTPSNVSAGLACSCKPACKCPLLGSMSIHVCMGGGSLPLCMHGDTCYTHGCTMMPSACISCRPLAR